MSTLDKAHKELFKRKEDETFETIEELYEFCCKQRDQGIDIWRCPDEITLASTGDSLSVEFANDGASLMNDWSFSQFCRLSGVSKETVNKLTPATAEQVFKETMPRGSKPMQFLREGAQIRSLHGTSYTRLWNAEVLDAVQDSAPEFVRPQTAIGGGTGLYCGEQDMFCFLIDPGGWVEVDDQAFAPGFFCWNSEVGRRSLGVQTFWFQAVCANHLVWDPIEVVEFSRKHTANIGDGLQEVRRILKGLVLKREERKDSFAKVIRRAMEAKLGSDAEEALKVLNKQGIPRSAGQKALKLAEEQGSFSVFTLIDVLTRMNQQLTYAGDRNEADQRSAKLFALVS